MVHTRDPRAHAHRVHPRLTPALLLAAALLVGGPSYASGMGIPATRGDHLSVTYDDGSGVARTYNLTCGHDAYTQGAEGAGGGEAEDGRHEQDARGPYNRRAEDDRDSADACAHLDRIGGPLPAVAPDRICTMMYGGPQTAQVTGVWHGRRVIEDYRRTNGCEVARWTRMIPVLPAPEPGDPGPADLRR
jgi:hypothetical protein